MNKSSIKFFINRETQAFAIPGLREIAVLWNVYVLDAVDGAIDVLCTCSLSSCWFFILSPGVLNRTPSHMFGRLYYPMFLLRVGLFILIKMDSFMVLARFWPQF